MKYRITKALLITCIGLVLVLPSAKASEQKDLTNKETVNDSIKEDSVPKDEVESNKEIDETKASNKTETPKEKPKQGTSNKKPVKTETNKTEIKQEETTEYKLYSIPNNSGFKSYMSYKAITSPNSLQYKLQSTYAYTGNYGIRQVNGRYCVAIGTFSNASIGSYIDVILENGTVIPCIVGDFKAPVHTDSSNIITLHNGCVTEFIVDKDNLHSTSKKMGDVSYCESGWKSPVKSIKVYNTNVLVQK